MSAAVAMRDWLRGPGGVDPSNVRTLLSPLPEAARAGGRPLTAHGRVGGALRVDGPADLECFTTELRSLLSTMTGDRLYVYIAARSAMSDPGRPFLGRSLILLNDFDPAAPGTGGFCLEELSAHLSHADFREVLTLLDCAPGSLLRERITPAGLGNGWLGRRRTGAPMQYRIQEPAETRWGVGDVVGTARAALTAAFLSAVAPAATLGAGVLLPLGAPDGNNGAGEPLRWSALERHLISVMQPPPTVSGPNPGMTLTPGMAAGRSSADRAQEDDDGGAAGRENGVIDGEVELRCADPHAMLIIEDGAGVRHAVGVGSIAGRLPIGRYTALLADPCGADPRVPLTVTSSASARVVLEPRPRRDGFRVIDDPAVRWSSPAAQLAMVTSALWANGHQSFLLVGGDPSLPPATELLGGFPDRFAAQGSLTAAGAGWWVARPVSGPWHGIGVDGHLLTVPAAPDSVTAVAISPSAISVALFDTTHPEPAEIAAQDRVQEYLAIGRLGAADLTSRSVVHAGQRWPWGASAAIRRLIDRTRASRAGELATPQPAAPVRDGVPPHQFRADVPPALRPYLQGRGPWAVWLDWPAEAGRGEGRLRADPSGLTPAG